MSSLYLTGYQDRMTEFTIRLLDSAGALISLNTNDKVRVKIGRAGSTPILEVDDLAALSGGTNVTHANPATLSLHPDDIEEADIKPGIYDLEVGVVDATLHVLKHAESGVFVLIGTQGGEET